MMKWIAARANVISGNVIRRFEMKTLRSSTAPILFARRCGASMGKICYCFAEVET